MKKWIILATGVAIGALGGFLYWYYIGCLSGTCVITSSPFNSTIYGSIMGALLATMLKRDGKESPKNDHP
jgi:predicted membrane protein